MITSWTGLMVMVIGQRSRSPDYDFLIFNNCVLSVLPQVWLQNVTWRHEVVSWRQMTWIWCPEMTPWRHRMPWSGIMTSHDVTGRPGVTSWGHRTSWSGFMTLRDIRISWHCPNWESGHKQDLVSFGKWPSVTIYACVYLSGQKGLWITGHGRCINAGAISLYIRNYEIDLFICDFKTLYSILFKVEDGAWTFEHKFLKRLLISDVYPKEMPLGGHLYGVTMQKVPQILRQRPGKI